MFSQIHHPYYSYCTTRKCVIFLFFIHILIICEKRIQIVLAFQKQLISLPPPLVNIYKYIVVVVVVDELDSKLRIVVFREGGGVFGRLYVQRLQTTTTHRVCFLSISLRSGLNCTRKATGARTARTRVRRIRAATR